MQESHKVLAASFFPTTVISIRYLLFLSLITIPIVCKISLGGKIALFPQEIIIPPLIGLYLLKSRKIHLPSRAAPYVLLFGALTVVFASTVFSWLSAVSIAGLFKTIKYLIYTTAFLLIIGIRIDKFEQLFNQVALFSIVTTLTIYFYNMITFPGSILEFLAASIWIPQYIPGGLSNLKFNPIDFSFVREGGSHGVYGTYLVLVFFFNFRYFVDNTRKASLLNYLICFLAFLNLALLTSREAFLVFSIVHLLFVFSLLGQFKIKKIYIYAILFLSGVLYVIIANNIDFGVVKKILYTIESFTSTGSEGNVNLRINVWTLVLLSYTIQPVYLLTGMGYNRENFIQILEETNLYYDLSLRFPGVPESFFFTFLSYGGIAAFFLGLLFWISLLINMYKTRNRSLLNKLFLFFTIALFITNNTGATMLSDLFFVQYALVYIWLNQPSITRAVQTQ